MYTYNKQLGIGEVKEIANGMVTIFFEDADLTKKVPFGFVTIYNTEEDAEESANPIMSIEALEAELLADNQRHINRMNNQEEIRIMNELTSRNCASAL
jgi:hypothetical protein